jgi:hypothetical protein
MSDLNKLAKFSNETPIVFSDKDVNDAQLKEKCLKAIESLRPCHGLAERLGEACFMIALSEIENGWQLRAKAAEAELARRDAAAGEPVAWQVCAAVFTDKENATRWAIAERHEVIPLYAAPTAPSAHYDYFSALVFKARQSAEKAMLKFPQPNYVLLKVAEEAGEVVQAGVHYAEGRETWEALEGEVVQTIAMLYRLVTEGDQVNGVIPPAAPGGE